MKGFISMGVLLFITLAVAVTALGLSAYSLYSVKHMVPVIKEVPVSPTIAKVVETVAASPSATPSPTKKVPVKTVTPVPVETATPTEK